MAELYREDQIRARKRHPCALCGRDILPGTQYIYVTALRRGRHENSARHIHCHLMELACIDAFDPTEDGAPAEILRRVCAEQCDKAQLEACAMDLGRVYSCERCQKALLEPIRLGAARDSVRESGE